MGELCRSLWEFARGVLGRCYFWLFALVLDPFDFYNRFKPATWPGYGVSLGAFFWVLGGLVLWTAFLTYHDLRGRTLRRHLEPDMPLHIALRWIARDSEWAAAYRGPDDQWIAAVKAEFLSRWQLGRFEMVGVDRAGAGGAISYVPPAMKGSADFDAHRLCDEEAPTHIWSDEFRSKDGMLRCFYNVCLDSRDVKATWPRRRLKDRILRRSPVERIGSYGPIFEQQDDWYYKRRTLPATPLEWILNAERR